MKPRMLSMTQDEVWLKKYQDIDEHWSTEKEQN